MDEHQRSQSPVFFGEAIRLPNMTSLKDSVQTENTASTVVSDGYASPTSFLKN